MSRLRYFAVLFTLLAVTAALAFSSKPPKTAQPIEQLPGNAVEVVPAKPEQDKIGSLEALIDVTAGHACRRYSWKDRGKSPTGYDRGLILTYAKAACEPDRSDVKVMTKGWGSSSADALTYMGIADISLESVFALTWAMGMRESSGRYCCGLDKSSANYIVWRDRGSPVPADGTEAGLYQTSWNSRKSSSELPKLFAKYSASREGCFAAEFQKGIRCSAHDLKNWGAGDGLKFQELAKACPAFAVEFAAVTFRVLRRHYGPINTKKVEYRKDCVEMFGQVRDYIEEHPGVCSLLK